MCLALNQRDLFIRQSIELVDDMIDLAVGGLDLALHNTLLRSRLRGSKLFVQSKHRIDEGYDFVVAVLILFIIKFDNANRELGKLVHFELRENCPLKLVKRQVKPKAQ